MGITNFHKMIKEKYSKAFQNKWMSTYDNVYVDLNYVLHFCSYSAETEENVFSRLRNFFDNILLEIIPTRTLTVCSDGVAPLAKLVLQRQRRLSVSKNISEKKSFNTILFTPGTDFMKNLKTKLSDYFKFLENIYGITVDYLDSETDEAELKLKYQLMQNMDKHQNDTHIIVTNDADVIVMLTTLKNVENTFVFCKNNNQNEVLSIGKLIDLHTDKVGSSINPNYDFAFVSIMMGNDYLPKIRLVNFEKIWDSYMEVLKVLPNGIVNNNLSINHNFLIKMFYRVINKSKQKSLNIITIINSFDELYSNYLDGLMWCFDTYHTGKCVRYDYMYEYQESPHPLGLIFNIKENPNLLVINKITYPPISPVLYAILVLPNFAKDLINKKYHKFLEKNDILYSVEKCTKCSDFCNKIKSIKTDLANVETELDDIKCVTTNSNESDKSAESAKSDKSAKSTKSDKSAKSTKLAKLAKKLKDDQIDLSKKLIAHKKNHDKLSLEDIKDMVSNFESYCCKKKI